MKDKSLIIFYIFGYTLKTKYKYLATFSVFFHKLVIENLQNHFIFQFKKIFFEKLLLVKEKVNIESTLDEIHL